MAHKNDDGEQGQVSPDEIMKLVLEFDKRLSLLEQAYQMNQAQILKEIQCLHEGLNKANGILSNGLAQKVADLIKAQEDEKKLEEKQSEKREALWLPIVKDFIRVAVLFVLITIFENYHSILGLLGVK